MIPNINVEGGETGSELACNMNARFCKNKVRTHASTSDFWGCGGQGDAVRSVFKNSCLFLRPRPWQFEIRDSADK